VEQTLLSIRRLQCRQAAVIVPSALTSMNEMIIRKREAPTKDHRYVLSVLGQIFVVAIAAAMIMATLISLRYIARRRAVGEFPFTDGSSMEKRAQSISVSDCT
ncbi:hypothetical protein DPMN_087459, partial [Dreissena polymorpha]